MTTCIKCTPTSISRTLIFFLKKKTAYEMRTCLEFRRVLFRSLGGGDARLVEEDVRRPQAPSRCLELVVVAHGDLGAHLLQREEVGVHTPASDHVAAGGRESNAAEAGEHRPGKEDGGPDAPAQCGIELARGGVRRIDLDRMIAAPADGRAEMDE